MTILLRTFSIRRLRDSALLRGAASAFDLRGDTTRQYRLAGDARAADAEAIWSDYQAVGADLRAVLDRYVSRP